MSEHKALYAAFDLFPTSKGASTHISHMAAFLFQHSNGGMLYTLGNSLYANHEVEGDIEIRRFSKVIPNYLQRALEYSIGLERQLESMPKLELVHFRDIWGGLAALKKDRSYKTVFEVNALPSIELPYRYSNMKASTLERLRETEIFCLNNSDQIVTPSEVIKKNIESLGIPSEKITVVPNAANEDPEFTEIELPDLPYIIYFGALQPWQGIDTLLKAMVMLQDLPFKLVICSSNRSKFSKPYRKMAEKLGVSDNIIWYQQLPKGELNSLIKNAMLSVAPLKDCSRNIEQGCSPLKIFESMACGTAVVASDLPVVREIVADRVHARLVPPDRPQQLSRVIRFLWEYPEERDLLAKNGQTLITSRFNWGNIQKQMLTLYMDVANNESKLSTTKGLFDAKPECVSEE